ncbi:MAG TPA: hypothetical protein DCP64_08660 [Sarcina sp.]|nr:hypothetical protein [Sarcina sp.]
MRKNLRNKKGRKNRNGQKQRETDKNNKEESIKMEKGRPGTFAQFHMPLLSFIMVYLFYNV